jgi:hypothetical protein
MTVNTPAPAVTIATTPPIVSASSTAEFAKNPGSMIA